MGQPEDGRDLASIVTWIRTASASLAALARDSLAKIESGAEGPPASDNDRDLARIVASIGAISASLRALARREAEDARAEDRGVSAPHLGISGARSGNESRARNFAARVDPAQPLSEVGWRLKLISDQIHDCGVALTKLLEIPGDGGARDRGKIRRPLAKLLSNIREQVCCISVIGQVKAGKSCLVNALANRPDFLPTNVNPWTGVVTQLHFGDPAGRQDGADFYFFGEAEWRRLVDGGGRLRELTERYVPGFDEARLREQIEGIRLRVKKRLGADFDRLLGQRHGFETCAPKLLEKYVCAGLDGDGEAAGSEGGQYCDLTRLADVYLPRGRFAYPAVVVDTPGTNDPLMVRDEITRQSLQASDIHVVVLTAQQTLAMADLALLRILYGLHKDRIIIFINRIDQLDDPAGDTKAIAASVSSWLRKEFPGVAIPVVAGSAWWAECAQRGETLDVETLFASRLPEFAEAAGAIGVGGAARWRRNPEDFRDAIGEAAHICSGIPQLRSEISGMMMRGPQAAYLRQAISVLQTLTSFVETSAGADIANLGRNETAPGGHEAPLASSLKRMQGKTRALQELAASIKRLLAAVGAELETIREDAKPLLLGALRRSVLEFSSREASRLREAFAQKAVTVWQCESHLLRRELETALSLSYGATKLRVLTAQKTAVTELRAMISRAGFAADIAIGDGPLADFYPSPPVAALGGAVALDLSAPWWSQLWKRGATLEQNCATLDRLIQEEFLPIVEEIARSADMDFKQHIMAAIGQFLTLCGDLVQTLHDEYAAFANGNGEPSGATEAPGSSTAPASVDLLNVRLAECREISARLDDLLSYFPEQPEGGLR